MKEFAPDFPHEAEIFVKEVRAGSIIADLIPFVAPFIGDMKTLLILEEFVRRYGARLGTLISRNPSDQPNSKSELQTFADAAEAVANDPNGSATLEVAVFEDGEKKIKAAFRFTTPEARVAQQEIEARRKQLEKSEDADRNRVLMVFTRSDVNDADIGKRSGERVMIEEISDKSLALMYGAALAEKRIKYEIRDSDENVYKKGFVVDVNVRVRNGKPVAYSVTHVHDVIDLPD